MEDFEENARNTVELEMKNPASNPNPVFEVMRSNLAESSIDLLAQLSHFEGGQREDADVANIAFEVFKSKLSLRSGYEIGIRFSEAIKAAGTQLQKLANDKQSIQERKWEDLADDDKASLALLGFSEEQSTGKEYWDSKKMTAITSKLWSDPDISADQRDAARKLRLGGDAWLLWQKDWLNRAITGDARTWKLLTRDEKKAANKLGFSERGWKNSSMTLKFLKPWGDEREEEREIKFQTSGTEDEKDTLQARVLDSKTGALDDPDIKYVDFKLADKTWKLSTMVMEREPTQNWSLEFDVKQVDSDAKKKADKQAKETVLVPPPEDSLPGFDVEVYLIADGSKIELIGGEWVRVATDVGDSVDKNEPTYSVIKTAEEAAAARDAAKEAEEEAAEKKTAKQEEGADQDAEEAEETGEDALDKTKKTPDKKKKKKMKGLSLRRNQEEEVHASELWSAYQQGIRVKVKSRGRVAYAKQLKQLDEALAALKQDYKDTRNGQWELGPGSESQLEGKLQELEAMIDLDTEGKEGVLKGKATPSVRAAKLQLETLRSKYTTDYTTIEGKWDETLDDAYIKIKNDVDTQLGLKKVEQKAQSEGKANETDDKNEPQEKTTDPTVARMENPIHDEEDPAEPESPKTTSQKESKRKGKKGKKGKKGTKDDTEDPTALEEPEAEDATAVVQSEQTNTGANKATPFLHDEWTEIHDRHRYIKAVEIRAKKDQDLQQLEATFLADEKQALERLQHA
eukprot:COSAG06_NODE_1357_length_9728_cov_485.880050_4_plen_740_part_01